MRYRPSPAHPNYVAQKDSGWGDIDVIGYSPTRYGADRVWVVSCKSWQVGLDLGGRLDQLHAGKEWHAHRELWVPKRGRPLVTWSAVAPTLASSPAASERRRDRAQERPGL